MAASHRRRLLYADGNLTVNGNLTTECTDNCIGVCVYDICFPSPILSPTPLPYGDVSGNGTSSIKLGSSNRLFPTLIITATASVAGCFLLLLAFYAYIRFRRRRRRRPPSAERDLSASGEGDDLFPGGEIDHHIWYIRTEGLDEGTISSIASLLYRSGDGVVDGRDCSVCLGEFRDGELVRLLPKCKHAFHLPCIDRWLRSHVSCPLCRAPIVPLSADPGSPTSLASPSNAGNSGPVRQGIDSSMPAENGEDEALPWEVSRKGIAMGIEIQVSEEGSCSRTSTSELPHINMPIEVEGSQSIRRSFSMDSFALDALVKGGGNDRNEGEFPREEEDHAPADGETPVANLRNNLRLKQKQPAKMERSLSSQSARWFFSINGRSRNSVLPL
ncbi:RING-H2 finger protein ATL52 [Platanthera zijinensis]|uniref:RING-type E3 ubiquitin transferase n=1 Tax=Platanthera zijinensis TaxID=2320716 RepID=A0AAP0G6L6_9ASPA